MKAVSLEKGKVKMKKRGVINRPFRDSISGLKTGPIFGEAITQFAVSSH